MKGSILGLVAAAMFGASTPLAKALLGDVRPQLLAGLLYCGAALAVTLAGAGRRGDSEAGLRRSDAPALAAVTLFGGVLAPTLMLIGLQRVSGVAGSLLLNLEAPLTMLLALAVFGEYLDRRALLGSAFIVGGAAVLGLSASAGRSDWIGIACITLACLGWAIDNNMTQRLSRRDPLQIVQIKTAVAGGTNLVLAMASGSRFPPVGIAIAALVLGGLAYGLSVVLDAYALRYVGAAREAAYFATAPLFGVITAIVVLSEALSVGEVAAGVVMVAGVTLLVTDRHEHVHTHEPISHDHRHRHDDGHHDHHHDEPVEEHAHPHTHDATTHRHAHVSDVHHRHRHG